MNTVFSRWPSHARSPDLTEAAGRETFPSWMLQPTRRSSLTALRSGLECALAVLSIVCLTFAAGVAFERESMAASALVVTAALSALASLAYVVELKRSLRQSEIQRELVFERAGISMWREDWTAAAREVAALRRRGITDVEAYYANRPEELRALCSKVMIRDVNAFTVEEAGAPAKAAFVGPLDQLLPHTDQTFVQWLVAFARGDRYFRSEAHITMPDGSVLDTLFAAALPRDMDGFANIIVTSLDITEYKREQVRLRAADAEIARASRISTVGALSASIAHEVNSPLAAVLANAQAALRCLQRPVPNVGVASEAISAVVAEATRAKDVVARTRAFVGNGSGSVAAFDIVVAAREASLLIEQELRSLDIALHLQAESRLPPVVGDVIQIQQVFTNLLLNAAQAMAGQSTSKEITISVHSEGDRIRVDVADSGPGIKAEDLERVFNSFYTTKANGMGIGLAICRNAVDAQGGSIWATNGANGGAVMHFILPARHA